MFRVIPADEYMGKLKRHRRELEQRLPHDAEVGHARANYKEQVKVNEELIRILSGETHYDGPSN